MFKLFIEQFFKNRIIQSGTLLCFIIEMIKSGSVIHSLGLFTLIYGIFFTLCYLIMFRQSKEASKKKERMSNQYRAK